MVNAVYLGLSDPLVLVIMILIFVILINTITGIRQTPIIEESLIKIRQTPHLLAFSFGSQLKKLAILWSNENGQLCLGKIGKP